MTQIKTLKDVMAQVDAATGPDRGLDLTIARALAPDVIVLRHDAVTGKNYLTTNWRYTDSVDACIALAGRALPFWFWKLERSGGAHPRPGFYVARLFTLTEPDGEHLSHVGMSDTPALAFLSAILTAKIALLERAGEAA